MADKNQHKVYNLANSGNNSGPAAALNIQENNLSNVALKAAAGTKSPSANKKKQTTKIKINQAIEKQPETENIDFMNIKKLKEMTFAKKKKEKLKQFSQSQELNSPAEPVRRQKNKSPEIKMISFNRNDSNIEEENHSIEEKTMEEDDVNQQEDSTPVSIRINNLMPDDGYKTKQNHENIVKYTNQRIEPQKSQSSITHSCVSGPSNVSRGQYARKSWLAQEKLIKAKKQEQEISILQRLTDMMAEKNKSVKIVIPEKEAIVKRPESMVKTYRRIDSQVGNQSIKGDRNFNGQLGESAMHDGCNGNPKRRKKQQFINLDDPDDMNDGVTVRFKEYKNNFLDMTDRQKIFTHYDVISIIITHDSKQAITVLYQSDKLYYIRLYQLESDDMNEYKLMGKHLKCYEVQQNSEGTIYMIPFLDAGVFRLMIFDNNVVLSDIHINELLGIDSSTIAINGVHDPIINACFLDNSTVFVNLFHKVTKVNWHFKYSFERQELIDDPVATKMTCTSLNFPIQNFYDSVHDNIYCFYRHGQCLTVNLKDINAVQYESIVRQSLGQMYFVYNRFLVANSSDKILFFQRIAQRDDHNHVTYEWEKYHQIQNGGFIYYIKGNTQIQITTERLIYFYKIDEDTGVPSLENCIYNYMNCSQMMFGAESRYCITYKTGQIDFSIFRRKYFHKFIVRVSEENFNHSVGLSMNDKNLYCVSVGNKIRIYDQKDYKLVDEFTVPFPEFIKKPQDEYRKKQRILNMKISQNLQFMAVVVGHEMPMDESENSYLFIYQFNADSWNLVREKEMDQVDLLSCSRQIEFNRKNQNEIFLTNCKQVLVYNFYNDDLQQTYVFQNYLNSQPIYSVFNKNQNCAIIGSFYDVLFINIRDDVEIDIDELFHIGDIRSVINLNQKFYVLANKCDNLLGYHLIEIDENYPDTKEPKFLINWKSKLDIGNASLYLVWSDKKEKDYLIVSYKSIHINTYTVLMVNLETRKIEYRLESYHLWENNIQSIMLRNHDQVIFTQEGMSIVSHGVKPKKVVTDDKGIDWMLRSLLSCSDLKLEMSNHLLFQHKKQDFIVSIQEQYQDESEQTYFENIYQLNIKDMSLRELMLCQSIFSCRQQYDIPILVEQQANPCVFFNSYLELEKTNLLSILSFDSKSIQSLLDEQKNFKFSTKYPLFYQTRYHDFNEELLDSNCENCQKQSGIDIAFDNLQIRALNIMISYVIKYQNSYVYSFLFKKNFMQLVQIGIHVTDLLNSDIFCYQFDYMEWPSIHGSNHQCIRPYNNSIFSIRQSYKKIFQDFELQYQNQVEARQFKDKIRRRFNEESKKIYKIKYTLNVLPGMMEDKGTLMDTIGQTDELSIFECKSLITYIEFKWTSYAAAIHQIGALFHLWYFVTFAWFINEIYVYRTLEYRPMIFTMMAVSLIYPTVYDFTQLKKQGCREYFAEFWNYFDQAHIWLGYLNIVLQWIFQDQHKNAEHHSAHEQRLHQEGVPIIAKNHQLSEIRKVITILVTAVMLLKTFFFLRIFKGLSYLVLMMSCVVKDLIPFLLFYIILLWMQGLVFNIIEVGNIEHYSDEQLAADNNKMQDQYIGKKYPGVEYHNVPIFLRQFLTCFRMSLGDFDFGESTNLSAFNSHLFFYNLIFTLTCTMIIFLNFIIAEVSSSYAKITEKISGLNEKERSLLIEEAEDMMLSSQLDDKMLFPKYLIMREIEL